VVVVRVRGRGHL